MEATSMQAAAPESSPLSSPSPSYYNLPDLLQEAIAYSPLDASPIKPNGSQTTDEAVTASPEVVSPKMPPTAKKIKKMRSRTKIDRWGADYLLTNPKSPLATADIRVSTSNPLVEAQFTD
jgi:hypothetical protein